MHKLLSKTWAVRLSAVLLLAAGAAYLVSADGPEFTAQDKAYYADANLVAFVRPGLVLSIVSVSVAADGTVKADFKMSDPKGLPLDRDGIYTPGSVSTSWVLARIPKGQTQYVSYTTRTQTSPITGVSAVQAGTDSGGTYTKVADGEYIYTFRTKLPADYDKTATHTVGLYGNRNLTEFGLSTYLADTTYSFVPDGSKVTTTRDVIKTVTCNKCHQDLSAHGTTGRKSMEVCVLCHQPQTTDPDTGNSVDMPVMIHKIHMGKELPSVQAGKPYIIIGNQQSVNDFSTVGFPADTRRCTFCHEQTTGAAQATAYLKPNRAACGACHDNVNFATGENHANLPQVSDNQCANCHTPQGELEFDVSIKGAHTIPEFSEQLAGIVFNLVGVTGAAPGKAPTVTFDIKTKVGTPVKPSEMNALRLVLAGPNTDYAAYWAEDARQATANPDGTYSYTFKQAIPADAKGSYTVGIEGYRNYTLLPGTTKEVTVRDAGLNKQIYFSVDGSTPQLRRASVSLDNCNKCHAFLSLHGGNRNTTGECVLCHNPNENDRARRPAAEMPAQSVDFRMMIHKIHTGEELGGEYVIYGFGGSRNDFSEVRYPGDRRNCAACHVNNSQRLPLPAGLLNVADLRGLLNPVGPESAACLSCHTTVYAASHALANTTRLGESCAACHGTSSEFSVDKVHAR
jgi:OmcA/MtrC family decaheme c-type cytochrome